WSRTISFSSFSASSGRPPARNCSTESRRCLISVWITPTTPASSRAWPPGSTSLYFTALFSIRSTLVPSSSLLRIASLRSASMRPFRLGGGGPPGVGRGRGPPPVPGRQAGAVRPGGTLERLALLLHRTLLRGQRLLLPLHGGLLVVLPLADLGQDAGLLGRLL